MSARRIKSFRDWKLDLVVGLFCSLFLIVCLRLFQIQILEHKKYQLAANEQHWGQFDIPAIRGDIFSQDGFLLAGTQDYYLLYADPTKVSDIPKLASTLSDFFAPIKYDDLLRDSGSTLESTQSLKEKLDVRYTNSLLQELFWVPLEHQVTPEQHDNILSQNLDGIGFETEPVRFYPEGKIAAHILGFVASDEEGEKQGYFGIEGAFNEDLKGRKGRLLEEVDASGVPILIGLSKTTKALEGSTLYLTLNRSVQFIIEEKLKEGVEKYDAKSGSVIVMDPTTGDIVALANYPTFDPSYFNDQDEEELADVFRKRIERKNAAIAETYEPGSIMKPLTVATAVDLGLVSEDSTFDDRGPVNYSGHWVDNWDGKHHGIQTVVQILQKSNNLGAAWVGHKVGSKNIHTYFDKFGLGERTNVELEGEDTGILRDYKEWTDIDLANISFGQGISATPLQMLNAFNVFANGGFLLQPRIVSKVVDNGKIIDIPTRVVRRVISKDTSDRMVLMLEKAAEGGEAKFFVLKNYKIAGKTGTAQIPIGGKYDPNKTNATFVGFVSGTKQFSLIVKLEEPRAKIFASESAVPIWMDITNELVKYFGLPPDKLTSDL